MSPIDCLKILDGVVFFSGSETLGWPFVGLIELYTQAGIGAMLFPLILILALFISILTYWKQKGFLPILVAIYSSLALSQSYSKVWLSIANAERISFEVFVLFILMFLSLDHEDVGWQRVFAVFFGIVFIYDVFFLFVPLILLKM